MHVLGTQVPLRVEDGIPPRDLLPTLIQADHRDLNDPVVRSGVEPGGLRVDHRVDDVIHWHSS